MTPSPMFDAATRYLEKLQDSITAALESLDPATPFRRDDWERSDPPRGEGPALRGWGRTRVIEGGEVFERGGVNLSCVHGEFSSQAPMSMPGEGRAFCAVGVSLVLHPVNPWVPTVHMNYRRLERGPVGWFGGGADLTPNYLIDDDARHFHRTLRAACEAHPGVADHRDLKRQCDDYFTLPHRGEMRGVGGIFFDHITTDPEATFAFVREAGDAFVPAYLPIVTRRRHTSWGERERRWQLLRRGRYVEFNLVCDRGTQFGLRTGGRTESILMSLPATACWAYDHHPEPGTPEADMVAALQPRDWA